MTIDQRQFNHLTEMGISLWQPRTEQASRQHIEANQDNVIKIDITELTSSQFFSDILRSLNLSIADLTNKESHLDIGLFDWYFNASKEQEISCHQRKLITPSIQDISQSVQLKKQLWHVIQKHLL